MGTNFYWKELPKELQHLEKSFLKQNKNTDLLYHIGKRSAAGRYCFNCGTTLCRYGSQYVHHDAPWYDVCPICGSSGYNSISFTWTFLNQKWIIERMANNPQFSEKLIKNEYEDEFTVKEFLDEIATPLQFQSADYFC